MRTLLASAALLLLSTSLFGQMGNEWIVPGQDYYKVKTAGDQIYRITYADLVTAGLTPSVVNPQRFQLFHRGDEVAIHVEGQFDASFDPGDYIEFYGRKNDGTLDRKLYSSPDLLPHNYYNLYSDSTAYFLTVGPVPGKRIPVVQPIENLGGLPAEVWHTDESLQVFTSAYSRGYTLNNYVALTVFDSAEGFTGSRILEGNSDDYTLDGITEIAPGAPAPSLEILLAGRSQDTTRLTVEIGPNAFSLRTIGNYEIIGFRNELVDEALTAADISASGLMVVRLTNIADPDNLSLFSPSYVKVKFSEIIDSELALSKKLSLRDDTDYYVEIPNFDNSYRIYDISDQGTVRELKYKLTGSIASTVIQSVAPATKLFLTKDVMNLVPEKCNLGAVSIEDYLIITHPVLRQGTVDPVQEYANFRSSSAGGSFQVGVHNITDLYDHFSYGEITPLAIFNFARYAYQNGDPEFLFLIGKGLEPRFKPHRPGSENLKYRDLVPPAGDPASDMYYTAGLGANPHVSAIPVGRLPASQPSEVTNYLNKVRNHQTFSNTLIDKNLLHLSGGRTPGEQNLFRAYMDGFKAIAEDPSLGGSVETLQRTSNGLTEKIDIREEVNEGLGMITMFGHSNEFFVDIEIGYASDPAEGYNNTKYPLIFANGCNAGRIFIDTLQWGPDWVLTGNKGAIGLIAHTFYGFSSSLRYYTRLFYSYAAGDSVYVNEPLGVIQQKVAEEYLGVGPTSYYSISQVQQMMLTGDPAVVLFTAEKPDYETDNTRISIDAFGRKLNSKTDSIRVQLAVDNPGLAIYDSVYYRLIWQTLADTAYFDYYMPSVYYRDTLEFIAQRDGRDILGTNTITISIDPDGIVDEQDRTNNSAILVRDFPSAGTVNIYPQPYQVVSVTEVPFAVQTGNQLPAERVIEFQLDTDISFSSSAPEVKALRGVLQDTLGIPDIDSVVYYWRTRYAEPGVDEDSSWTVSSFMYIDGGNFGFAQAEKGQFQQNSTAGYTLNEVSGNWEFDKSTSDIRIITHGNNSVDNDNTTVEVFIDELPIVFQTRACRDNSLGAIAFDQNTLKPYAAIEGIVVNPITCGRTPQVVNSLSNADIINRDTLETYFNNVRDGDYIAFFSIGNLTYTTWPSDQRNLFLQIGIDQTLLDTLETGEPLIFFGRKAGDGSETVYSVKNDTSSITDPAEQTIFLDHQFDGQDVYGTMRLPDLGPALSWSKLVYDVKELTAAGSALASVEGNNGGDNSSIVSNVAQPGSDLSTSFRNLSVELSLFDSTERQAPQPDLVLLEAKPLPEGILLFADNENGQDLINKVQEGQSFATRLVFVNISNESFDDSLRVKGSIGSRPLESFRISAPEPGQADTLVIQLETNGLSGRQDLEVIVNPGEHPEMLYENNSLLLESYLQVDVDEINPLIDVTFDGQYILDGDIVSPTPSILISVKDENEYLRKQDTVGIVLLLDSIQIFLSDPAVSWTAATDEDDFELTLRPGRLSDGIHTLKVNVEDASGNEAGPDFFSINFEVVNESTITHFYPYPNPFSTQTRFVFTLTGSEVPDELKIQILTVSGRVVREINQDEIGPLRIGNNRTEFAWDGRDEFGDQLANGVYLYRVIARINGQEIKHRNTSADQGFKNGFGKMYLLR